MKKMWMLFLLLGALCGCDHIDRVLEGKKDAESERVKQCKDCKTYALKREYETFEKTKDEMKLVHNANVARLKQERRECIKPPVLDETPQQPPYEMPPKPPAEQLPDATINVPNDWPPFSDPTADLTPTEKALALEIGALRTMDNIRNRVVCLGDDFVGTPARLNYCVFDMRKSAVRHLQKLGFKKEEIRIITNAELTGSGIKKWIDWAYSDTQPNDKRGVFGSMHGSEDTDASGKIMQIIVTYDMVSTGRWSAETEVEPGWITAQLQGVVDGCNAMLVLDLCHAGGVRPLMRATRTPKSIEGPDYVVQRVTDATQTSKAFANINTLNCTFIPMCGAGQLSEESSGTGGAGTWAFWRAIDKLGPNARAVDIVKEMRIDLRANGFSQTPECLGKYALKAPYQTK